MINFSYWISGIIVTVVVGYMSRQKWLKIINHFFLKVNYQKINELTYNSFIIKNNELLNDSKVVRKNKYIYWPVVPTDSINLIHILFIFYLNKLSKNGLKVIVFVFDEYYKIIKNKNSKLSKEEVNKFIYNLNRCGLKECKFKIYKESEMLTNYDIKENFNEKLYSYLGDIHLGKLQSINYPKQYIHYDTPSIRFFKPILNMVYLKMIPHKIGFTLAGLDEEALWDSFKEYVKDGQSNIRLTNFYIPILPNISTGQTDVLDKQLNITINDSKKNIYEKLLNNIQCLEQNGLIHIILDTLYFKDNRNLLIKVSETDHREYKDLNQLCFDLQNDKHKLFIISSLSHLIYEWFH